MILKTLASVTLLSCSLCSFAALDTENDKLSYSLGVSMAEQLKQFGGININAVIRGVEDNLGSQTLQLSPDEITSFVDLAQVQKQNLEQVKYQKAAQESLEKANIFWQKTEKNQELLYWKAVFSTGYSQKAMASSPPLLIM